MRLKVVKGEGGGRGGGEVVFSRRQRSEVVVWQMWNQRELELCSGHKRKDKR